MPKKLNIPIKYTVHAKVIDPKTGEVIEERKVKGESFLLNFAKLCRLIFMRGDVTESEAAVDTGGTSQTLMSASGTSFPGYTPAAGDKMFICVGTNSTAVSRDNYYCITPVGTAVYSDYTRTDTGTSLKLNISFSWTNTTGAAQNIAEVGLVIRCIRSDGTKVWICIARDIFSPAISVPAGSVLAVGYTITFPW